MARRSLTGLLVAAVLIVSAGVGAWWYVGKRETASGASAQQVSALPASGGGPPPVVVDAAAVRTGVVTRNVGAVGTLRSNESVVLKPEVAGRIAEIHFSEGERVRKGAPLVSLDASVNRAELAQAEARLALAKTNAGRAAELYQRRVGTERGRDEAEADLRTREAEVALVRARLEKTKLQAPFDGVLGLRKVSVGDYVNPGQEIVNLEQIDPLKVDFRVPEQSLRDVRDGQRLEVQVDAFPDQTFTGTVYAIDPLVDVEGRSIVIRARLPNPEGKLRPGLFARVNLIVDRREDAILVPEQAIVPLENGTAVFRVIDGKAVLTPIKVGQRRAGEVEIRQGLKPGEVIITAGQIKVRNNAPVTVRQAQQAGTTG